METPARVDSQNMERYWKRKNNFGKSSRKSKRTKSKSSEKDHKQQVSHLKLELNTANNRNKTDNVLENINTEQRKIKIYGRLIYIHKLSSITKEIIKQESQFSNLLQTIFKGVICLSSFLRFFHTYL